ncbi:hypothetical protein SSP531S_43650 [Streptomyces spongiicola]|uniref:Lipoprotein CseA n=1 Tax=Streptomyces spongiicola TaxID=1690221 RepID=A0A388T408_9ACTN|nr:hypothetical protein [Streptomyces spongiicola]GBQ02901.1 hypothetical protein SSP531S_43650 [Streptomyces spongiicola]
MAGLAALGLLAVGCSTGGLGPRDEGPAPSDPVARSPSTGAPSATASAVSRVDAVALLKNDPEVSERAKADLRPCAAEAYAIDTSYGTATGNATAPDVVVNLMTCGDAVGIGTYVYRATNGTYENVFAKEEPAVYATIDRGDLVVTQQVYAKDDPVTYPSGEIVTTYRWSGSAFTEHDRVQNEYGRVAGGEDGPPATSAPSED